MKLTKSKLKQIIKEEITRVLKEEVIDLGKYKAKKEREGMKDTVLVTKEPSYSGEHTIYDPGEFELVVVNTEEQYTALLQGDFSKAEDLGAQFDTIMFGLEEGGMPSSVAKHKQKLADMSDEEFAAQHGDKSEQQLRQMAWRHGYGRMSSHYVNRVKHAKKSAKKKNKDK